MLDKIVVRGARANNLKNIDVEIPRDKLVVMTGLSGSGKSPYCHSLLQICYYYSHRIVNFAYSDHPSIHEILLTDSDEK